MDKIDLSRVLKNAPITALKSTDGVNFTLKNIHLKYDKITGKGQLSADLTGNGQADIVINTLGKIAPGDLITGYEIPNNEVITTTTKPNNEISQPANKTTPKITITPSHTAPDKTQFKLTPQHLDRVSTSFADASKIGLDITETNLPNTAHSNPHLIHSFIYNQHLQKWSISGKHVSYLSPFSVGPAIPKFQPPITFFSVTNNNWIADVHLPENAIDGDLIILSSSAAKTTTVRGNIFPQLPLTLNAQKQHTLRYSAADNHWIIE